jgi:hypothetical protein
MQGNVANLQPCHWVNEEPLPMPRMEDVYYYLLSNVEKTRTLYHERWLGNKCVHVCKARTVTQCGEVIRSEETKKLATETEQEEERYLVD